MACHITPAASEGVLGTRGIVPPAIPRYFFSSFCSSPNIFKLSKLSYQSRISYLVSRISYLVSRISYLVSRIS
ncbi:hypothetical protein F0236_14300 [Vibrio splendidus]|nr:hypothetical protein [Vibrio splendidus]